MRVIVFFVNSFRVYVIDLSTYLDNDIDNHELNLAKIIVLATNFVQKMGNQNSF